MQVCYYNEIEKGGFMNKQIFEEKIDSEINPLWSELTKSIYLYKSVVESIEEDMNYGAALFFKEALERHEIKNEIVTCKSNAVINILEVNSKHYAIDIS
jgi:hypothetical protein